MVAEFQETRSDQSDKTFTADGLSITSVTVTGDSAKPQEEEEERLHNDFERDIRTQGIQVDIKPSKYFEGTMRQIFSPSRTSTDEQSTTVGSVVRRQKNISAKVNVRLPIIKTRPGTCTPGGPGRHGVLTTKHPKPLPPYYAPALLKRLHDEYMALGACSKKRMVYFNRLVEP
ncbi:unnamed protein product [Dibothriocephalus latus]|uniref:Uncharacterized protein n=1 Tax=Dibothriocephalus latus TaxID=60516 RepID=A0A3P6T9E4_DIBLA|nr:unnamed protein product [Dibothriocephalus latus]